MSWVFYSNYSNDEFNILNNILTFYFLSLYEFILLNFKLSVGCADSFNVEVNKKSQGGITQYNANTLNDCIKTCINLPGCLGFDYDVSANYKCFTHNNAVSFSIKVFYTGVDQYTIQRCGVSPGTLSFYQACLYI